MRALRVMLASLVLASIAVVVPQGTAGAEGTESLGPAQIPLAEGSGIESAGVGMVNQPAALSIGVPPGATVKQVLLYWEGESLDPSIGDDTINVNGTEVTGSLIGGPAFFFKAKGGTQVRSSSFRADITHLGLVSDGPNQLTLSDLTFDVLNSGAGVIVIYDDGSGISTIDVRDGIDNAFRDFQEPRKTTVPQSYTFPAAGFERTAGLSLFVGSVDQDRPSAIDVTVGGATTRFTNLLGSHDGDEFDALHLPITVPAGVTTAAVQLLSVDDGTGRRPASLEWVTSALSVPTAAPPCVTAGDISASGRAFGLKASLLNGTVKQSPTPDTDRKNPATLAYLKIGSSGASVQDELLTVVNEPSLTETQARDVATATSNNLAVDLPGVKISASTVVARSASTASGTTAGSSRAGSTVQDLVVNGRTYGNINEPVDIDVRDPLTNKVIAQVRVLETTRTGAAGGVPQPEGVSATSAGTFKSGMTVNALHVILYDLPLTLGVNEASDLVVGHATSRATFPSTLNCETLPQVRGSAFLASVDNVDPDVATVVAGQVRLPITGGEDEANAADTTPLGLVTGRTRTEGTLSPLQARSTATTEDADLLGGLITAKVIESTSTTEAGSSTGTATIAELTLAGVDACGALGLDSVCRPGPNTVVTIGPATLVVLNEQLPEAGGLTVNAVHIHIIGAENPFGLPVGAEVILSSSTSGTSPAP